MTTFSEHVAFSDLNIFSYGWATIVKLDSRYTFVEEFIGHFLSGNVIARWL